MLAFLLFTTTVKSLENLKRGLKGVLVIGSEKAGRIPAFSVDQGAEKSWSDDRIKYSAGGKRENSPPSQQV